MNRIKNIIIPASQIFADSKTGFSRNELINFFRSYESEFDRRIIYDDIEKVESKKTTFCNYLKEFSDEQIFYIINDFCNHIKFKDKEEVIKLRIRLHNNYKEYNTLQVEDEILDLNIVEKTKHWLDLYPEVKKIYEGGINKYSLKIYERNILDDMRLSLELLLRKILNNNKNLERQREDICRWLDSRETSSYFRNMFWRLIDYYAEYQNNNIKHNDKVNKQEIEFIIEMTSLFMKNIVKFKDSEE